MRMTFFVRRPGHDQLTFSLINAVNDALDSGALSDAFLFFEEPGLPCVRPRFAMAHFAEAYGDRSPAVATCLQSAAALREMPGPSAKAFYVWDLEWMRGGVVPFRDLRAVYGCPYLRLAARGRSHKDAIASAWNRDVSLVEEFDVEALKCIFS